MDFRKFKIKFIFSKIRVLYFYIKAILFRQDLDYKKYWNERYKGGGNSGRGSYGNEYIFKANFLNNFFKEKEISSVVDFGCGDCNQIKDINLKKYLGLDISKSAIKLCQEKLAKDLTKSFLVYEPFGFFNKGFLISDAVICLDVLYHIVKEEDFKKALEDIFSFDARYVIIYSTLMKEKYHFGSHGKHIDLLDYLKKYPKYTIDNICESKTPLNTSFIVLKKV